ncbi:MAG: hypothetical protein CMJ76_01220 [Planctomycetaceae bacterium]|nr:hypothetical protein [Planctomycetaceae bacterium]|tara:strand:+ start:2452 stop:2796 length:345 start_codon:yes stop_codon:yes gene_type:complete
MLDKSIKTHDRTAKNAVMKVLLKVLLGTIVGCLFGTLLAIGGIAILIAVLMSSSAGGGAPIGAGIAAIGILFLCLLVGGIWGVIFAVKGWWPFYKGSFSAVKGWWPFRKKARNQ